MQVFVFETFNIYLPMAYIAWVKGVYFTSFWHDRSYLSASKGEGKNVTWLPYYLEQKYIGKIIIRLLIHQMTRKKHNLIIETLCMYLVNNNNGLNYLHMLLKRYFEKGWRSLPSHFESKFFLSISNDALYLLHSCLLTNHLIYNRVWSDHGNDKAILWHHCSSLKVRQQP